MKKVVIFGTGGLAKELIGYLMSDGGYEIACAVSTEPFNNAAFAIPVVERLENAPDGASYLMAVSEPAVKRKIVSQNADKWASYAHRSAFVSPHTAMGRGCILAPQALIVGDCVLGDFVFMNTNATVGHDSRIGDYSTMMPNTEVCGNVDVGEDVFIGIGAYVLSHRRIGARAKLSAGCVVRHDVADGATVYGDPAKVRA